MADIKLNDLQSAGSEFFADNEGYLNDLSEDELTVWGGGGDDGNLIQNGLVNVGVNALNNSNVAVGGIGILGVGSISQH